MPPAGKKNRILYLQKPTRAISSTSGEESESWTNVGFVYAEVTPKSGTETVESGQNSATRKYTVRINYRPDVNAERRFLIDDFTGQLNGAITSGTSVVVDDATFASFAQARRLRVLRIDDELMTISSISSNTITVTRAQFGTTQANHADNAKVILYRQLNIESVMPNATRSDLMCDCIEVN
jgi:SPP1 family predicted phage head-tail adaptor